jgi:hypothetical protein
MGKHRTIAGVLQIVLGLSVLLIAGLLFAGYFAGDAATADRAVAVISSSVGTGVGVFLTALALAFFVSAFGLLENLRWSRPVAWVMGIIGLFVNVPLGTIISAYVIWMLVKTRRAE